MPAGADIVGHRGSGWDRQVGLRASRRVRVSVADRSSVGCASTRTRLPLPPSRPRPRSGNVTDRNLSSIPTCSTCRANLRFGAAEKIRENSHLDFPWEPPRAIPVARRCRIPPPASARHRTPRPRRYSESVSRRVSPSPTTFSKIVSVPQKKTCSRQGIVVVPGPGDPHGRRRLVLHRAPDGVAAKRRGPTRRRNLLILDSVAGFETLIGDRNSFGERMSRRARVAQLMRAAGVNWHTIFVVEEPSEGMRLPEEYVTDTVLHLRRRGKRRAHAPDSRDREEPRAIFRRGRASVRNQGRTGNLHGQLGESRRPYSLLHPECVTELGVEGVPAGRRAYNAYVQVFPSLHFLSREFARYPVAGGVHGGGPGSTLELPDEPGMASAQKERRTSFRSISNSWTTCSPHPADSPPGLPGGSTTALVGDEGTRKSTLAEHFLAQAFTGFPDMLDQALDAVEEFKIKRGEAAPRASRSTCISANGPRASGPKRRLAGLADPSGSISASGSGLARTSSTSITGARSCGPCRATTGRCCPGRT